jgi:HSP20 family protein
MQYLATRRPMNPAGDLFNARGLGRILDEVFQSWPQQENGTLTSSWYPACDVFEDKEAIKIVAEVPGVQPQDVKLTLENNLLTIRGEKKQEAEERTERVHRYERSYGSFERAFSLPSTVDPDRIRANYEHGILTVTLPKSERARPREIEVKVG